MKIRNVILSGGIGTRLWPLSRKSRPKQYLPIFEGETLFKKTVIRNLEICDEVIVVGNSENFEFSRKELKASGVKNYSEIIEASPRNTAAAIAFAAFASKSDDILFVSPSDHLIDSNALYRNAIERGIELAKKGFIVTFGLKPTKADTGFGYIEAIGEDVKSFREKPLKNVAEDFLKVGNFFWNSGMFCFKAEVFLKELEIFEPEVYKASKRAYENSNNGFLEIELSLQIPSISVDYAVLEKTKKIKMVGSHFSWSDMGSFESIYDYFKKNGYPVDKNGNMVLGNKIHTEFAGLENTILIQTDDAILVLKKDCSQDVKKVFERLENDWPNLVK